MNDIYSPRTFFQKEGHSPIASENRLISSITVGQRARKEMGNLRALADSIAQEGLLQPIGITDTNELVFGERRLRACRDILGWDEIEVRVVDVTSIAAGEQAENEVRKDFTPSERVAIAEAVRRELGDRRGSRTDRLQDGSPDVQGQTRDIAARKAGFASGKQLERAVAVVAKGVPELVDAMDRRTVSITAAEQAARLPEADQREIASKTGSAVTAALKQAQAARTFRDSLPPPKEARAMAKQAKDDGQPGLAVIASDGRFHTAATQSEIDAGRIHMRAAGVLRELRDFPHSGEEIAAAVSMQGHETFQRALIGARRKLDEIAAAWERRNAEAA